MALSIEDPSLNHINSFIPPIIITAVALLAGKTRLIEYFEGASSGGLFLCAAFGSAGTVGYDHYSKNPQDFLIGRTVAIALGTLVAYSVAKGLSERISLSLNAAIKFALVSAGLVSLIPPKNPLAGTLEQKHALYLKDPKAWIRLSVRDRTELVDGFYTRDLPPLQLEGTQLHVSIFKIYSLKKVTENQAKWLDAILLTQDLNILESIRHNDQNDYTYLRAFCDRYPEMEWLLDPNFISRVRPPANLVQGVNFSQTFASLRSRITNASEVSALTYNQLRGFHNAFEKENIHYNNFSIPQSFNQRFKFFGLSEIPFNSSCFSSDTFGKERKVSVMD